MKELMLELDFVNLKKYDGINQCNLVQKKKEEGILDLFEKLRANLML